MMKLISILLLPVIPIAIALATPYQYSIAGAKDVVEVEKAEMKVPPQLARICSCESTGKPNNEPRQFDDKGLPLRHKNNDKYKSSDWGRCQINDYWWDKIAKEKGLDYKNNPQHNDELALWIYIYAPKGPEEWRWSKYCWAN